MKKKVQVEFEEKEENAFSLSTGDLMAGLLFIFILLLMSALLRVQEQAEQDADDVRRYEQIKTQLYIDLQEEFKDDLTVWRATIDSTLCVRFQEPSMLFDYKQTRLKPAFIEILDDFFPRYLSVISNEKYKDDIEEIRIEGHTDSQGSYEYNMELSQGRTRAVLNHCLALIPDSTLRDWTIYRITANGLSSSHLMYDENGIEIPELSRRVEFRIRTNAEKQLEDIAEKRFKKHQH